MNISTHRVLFAMSSIFLAFSTVVFGQESPSDNPTPDPRVLLLAEQSVQADLKLTDEAIKTISLFLDQRANETVEDASQEPIRVGEIDRQILALLTEEQLTQFEQLANIPRLSFSFREAKWIDVLNWFAKQSKLSLLVNDPPPDSFTYSDPRTYTPREAIDLLNGVLVTKGYTLIRKDKLLVCLRVAGGIPDGLIPQTTVEGLKDFGAFELVKVTFPLEKRDANTVTTEIKPLLGQFGDSVLLPQSQQLIVTATAGNMRSIAVAIESIKPVTPPKPPEEKPKPPAPQPSLVAYDVAPAKVSTVRSLLTKILGDNASLTVDEESNKITAYVVPSQHALIESILTQVKNTADSDNEPYLTIYPYAGDGFELLSSQAAKIAKNASLNNDSANRRLLVFANKEDHAAVVKLMEQLSGRAPGVPSNDENVVVFNVEHVEIASIADALTTLFPAVRISTEPTLRKLIVRGDETDREQISQLLERLDQQPARRVSPRFVDLDRILTADQTEALQTVAPEATIRPQQNGRQLMVIGTLENHLAIESLLTQFRQRDSAAPEKQLKDYEVDEELKRRFLEVRGQLDPSLNELQIINQNQRDRLTIIATEKQHVAVAELLTNLRTLTESVEAKRLQVYDVSDELKRQFLALRDKLDPELNSIEIVNQSDPGRFAVLATDTQHEGVAKLLEDLKLKLAPALRELRTYDVAEQVRSRFDETRRTLAPELQSVTVVDAGRPDKLAVVATPDQHMEVEALLQTLAEQFPEQPTPELKLYSVSTNVKRQFIAALPTLQESISGAITVVSSDQENELLLSATAEAHAEIAEAIERLQLESAPVSRQFVGYPITKGDVQSIHALLVELYPNGKIIADDKSQQILVWAEGDQQEQVKVAIEQMDVEAGERSRNKMAYYKLDRLDARDVVAMFRQLVPDMTIQSDRRTNSLIAWGSEKDHVILEKAVTEFRNQSATQERSVVVYDCGSRDSYDVRGLVRELVEDVTVVHDRDTRVIMVWATADDHATVKRIVEQVKGEDSQDSVVKAYATPDVDADSIIAVLSGIVPKAKLIDAARDTKVVAFASEADHERIEQFMQEMGKDDPNAPAKDFKSYDIPAGVRNQLRNILDAAVPNAVLAFADDEGSVTVFAVAKDHEVAEAAIKSISTSRLGNAKKGIVKSYATPAIDADYVVRLLNELFPESQFFDAAADKQVVAWASEEEHPQIATIVKEMNSQGDHEGRSVRSHPLIPGVANQIRNVLSDVIPNATIALSNDDRVVTIWADEADHATALEMIESTLAAKRDSDKELAGVVKVYPLGENVDATEIANSLPADLIDPQSIRAASGRNALIVRAPIAKHEEIKIALANLVKDLPEPERQETTVYQFKNASPSTAVAPLSTVFPNATITYNDSLKHLIVSALPREHESILGIVEQMDVMGQSDRETKIYRFQHAAPSTAISPLSTLFPSATFASDANTASLIVTATAEQHATMAKVIADLDAAPAKLKVTKVYRFTKANPSIAVSPLNQLLPNATFAVDPQTSSLIATAFDDQHVQIQEVIEKLDVQSDNRLETKVFRLTNSKPDAVVPTLSRLVPNATIAVDAQTNSVIATGTFDDLSRISQVTQDLDAVTTRPMETRVYQMTNADPGAAERVLARLLPNATIAVDPGTKALIATATPSDHETIQSTIEQFDKPSGRTNDIQVYALARSDANSVFETLGQMYANNPNVRLSLDRPNRAILARAPPSEQQAIASIVARMETGNISTEQLTLEIHPLNTFDATNTIAGLESLFRNDAAKPDFKFDMFASQMLVVATPEQHRRISASLEQLAGEPTDIEVFQLRAVDSFTVEQAIDQLFLDAASGPVVSSDPDTQQLIVRGTTSEIAAIRELLSKMGEIGLGGGEQTEAGSRVVPFRGNVESAVRQLQSVWPQLRANQLNVLEPNEIEAIDTSDDGNGIEFKDSTKSDKSPAPSTNDRRADSPDDASAQQPGKQTASTQTRFVTTNNDSTAAQDKLPPVFIVPGANSITVSSDDLDALAQAESLLRVIAQQVGTGSSAGNFAVFRLRNAGARSVAQLLTKLFEQMPETTRGSLGRVSLVADDRMNAIVVHGRPADRSVLGQLLSVLDTDNADDSLANAIPEIVAVHNTNAERILEILQTVYQSQLQRGGQAEEVEIPEGIDSEVASVLRQINAATAGPLLTLEVDSVTNSIIVLAPKLLGEQVASVIAKLDTAALTSDTRSVQIIPLTDVKSEILEEAIREFIQR
ncbi:MAG: hypothetical protein KDB27_14130 [Planctomycetales bacterium]|nr:hypothetical protein [Planctomycetales bacterium]